MAVKLNKTVWEIFCLCEREKFWKVEKDGEKDKKEDKSTNISDFLSYLTLEPSYRLAYIFKCVPIVKEHACGEIKGLSALKGIIQ